MIRDGVFPEDLKESLNTSDPFVRAAAEDFGHLVTALPLGVLRPRSVSEIQRLVAFAGPRGVPVTACGSARSVYGQGQAPGGVVVDMGALNRVLSVQAEHIVVEAGIAWHDVLAATLPYGLAPPVLTEHLAATVGGVLSTGGIGGASHRHGLVTDTVLEIEVVTGAGERVTCTPEREAALFHAVMAGLGRPGIIVRAVIRLVPAPERVRRYRLFHHDFARHLADQRRLATEGRFHHLQGEVRPSAGHGWLHMTEAAAVHPGRRTPDDDALLGDLSHDPDLLEVADVGYREFLDRFDRHERILRVTGEWGRPHPWLFLLLPDATVQDVVTDVLADPAFRDLRTAGRVVLSPLPAERLNSPALRRPAGPMLHLFGLLRTAPPDDPRTAARMVADNRAAYERTRALGAVAYPVGALPMTAEDWRDHYGDQWQGLTDVMHRYDPHAVLGSGGGPCR